jgi:hypothetical protein
MQEKYRKRTKFPPFCLAYKQHHVAGEEARKGKNCSPKYGPLAHIFSRGKARGVRHQFRRWK